MKRFWTDVEVQRHSSGWIVALDGRPLHTPARALLVMPVEKLAQAVSDEWRSLEGKIEPRAMPMTGLANAAIDRVAPEREAFAEGIARYAETDLACYRAEAPRELVERQESSWGALLAWARRRYDVDFATTCGILHVAQPGATLERLTHVVGALDPFRLAGLSPLVSISGSLLVGLAVLEAAITPETAWDAVTIDECWQLEHWGADEDALAALRNRRADLFAAARFLELLSR